MFCCLNTGSDEDLIHGLEKGSPGDTSDAPSFDLFEDEGEGYQKDLWLLLIDEKSKLFQQASGRSSVQPNSASQAPMSMEVTAHTDDPADHITSPTKFLQSLNVLCKKNEVVQWMPRLRGLFNDIHPFVASVHTLAQSNAVSGLAWSSLCLVFEFWGDLQKLFQSVALTLPRFHAYVQILHTPRLHTALRRVYAAFLDICFMTHGFFRNNKCDTLFRFQWSSFMSNFKTNTAELELAKDEFEREASLASVQEGSRRHNELRNMLHDAIPKVGLQTNIDIPRNEKFTGRDETLEQIHSILSPGVLGEVEARVCSSCLIHGIGGMGKTETALEYTYRYRRHYSHIFWLRSQTEALLQASLIDVVKKLNISSDEGAQPSKLLELAFEWFRTTKSTWMLVYDNVEDIAAARAMWPMADRGAILVTSQNPALAQMTKHDIPLRPMQPDEGAALIQKYLSRGSSEKDQSEQLAESLGGMPLAIVHFTGYIARSNCPVDQISKALSQQLGANTIREMGSTVSIDARGYQFTLDTVWSLAFHRLTEDAMLLLEYISFLDPDHIPVELFVGDDTEGEKQTTTTWKYWTFLRFNEAVGILCERHLVNRSVDKGRDSLRTHRALQMSVLQKLNGDPAKRADRFNTVVAIVSKAVPRANIVKRIQAELFNIYARHLPQMTSIRTVFAGSVPPIDGSVALASLLHDFAWYTLNIHANSTAFILAETSLAICEQFPHDSEAKALLPTLLNSLAMLNHYRGVKGRQRGLEIMRRVMKIREEELRDIPQDQWTEVQSVDLARAQGDLAWAHCELNMLEEAEPFVASAKKIYERIGNKIRLAQVSVNQMMFLSTRQEKERTLEQGQEALGLLHSLVAKGNPLSLILMTQAAHAYWTIGEIESALETIEFVWKQNQHNRGRSHDLTLAARYTVAVFAQYLGNLEDAENHLREVLKDGCQTDDWREEDIVRAKFRLSVVLRTQNRVKESKKIRGDIEAYLSEQRCPSQQPAGKPLEDFTDADDMAILDYGVTLCHGRTAGVWGTKNRW